MGRMVIGIIVGLLVGCVTIGVIEAAGFYLMPPPAEVQSIDPAVAAEAIRNLPLGSFLFLLVAWFVGTFLAAFLATWIGGRGELWPALVIGFCFELCGLAMIFAIPSPLWFSVIGAALFFPAALAGRNVGRMPLSSSETP